MLTALGLRGFVMQIYTPGQVAVECGRERGERGETKGVFTPNSHVRSSEVSNWQTFESHFADERIKWQSAQKLLQNIRITEMFLLLYIYSMYVYMLRYRFLISRLFAFCSSEFSGVSQFTFSHTATAAPPSCFNWNVH